MKDITKVIKTVKHKSAIFIFPHPDDESVMSGGLLRRLVKSGFTVTVLILTRGERGQVHINGNGKSVAQIRKKELETAINCLDKAISLEIWEEPDGRLKQEDGWKKRLSETLERTRPGLVVTYGPSGVTGHPDHIAVSEWLYRWQREHSDGLLLWVVANEYFQERMRVRFDYSNLVKPEYVIKLSYQELFRKMRAVLAHKSQGFRQKQSFWRLQLFNQVEYYAEPKKGRSYEFKYFPYEI